MPRAIERLQAIWHDMFSGQMFISREWWAEWDASFMKKLDETEALIGLEKGPDFDPLTATQIVQNIRELGKIVKSIGICDNGYNIGENGKLELASSARRLMNDCVGNELHKIVFLIDDPGGPLGSIERVRDVIKDMREFINEFKALTEEV
jgi:hypothetical protein